MGGLYSFDGYATSAGMLSLVSQLGKLPDTKVKWYLWADYLSCFKDQNNEVSSTDKMILIGYSGGGWRICTVSALMAKVKEPVDLLVAYDPSPSWNMSLDENCLRNNVKHAICYQNDQKLWIPLLGNIGGGRLYPYSTLTKVDIVPISQNHLTVQFNQDLHARTVATVRAL